MNNFIVFFLREEQFYEGRDITASEWQWKVKPFR
jgi:hypothetical protein